jgi:signal transduction histidine kinase
MAGVKLADGRIVVIGRSLDSLDNLRSVVLRALKLGMGPAVVLALLVGFALGYRSYAAIREVNSSIEGIMQGNLHERLPVRGHDSAIDNLSARVNFMLDKIEQLLADAKSTGDNIAHDLRTPLTRVRSRLERAGLQAKTQEEFHETVVHAITGLDQALRIITALLRISQIERHAHHSQFSRIDIGMLISEIGDLFEPIAEERNIRFAVTVNTSAQVDGDRDLLSEAVANLVDNALKFTPAGGLVLLEATETGAGPVIRVIDNGPGIPLEEQEFVTRRFFRSDKSRHIEGNGLGLSIVAAIVKYHGFSLSFHNLNPGCVFEIACKARG